MSPDNQNNSLAIKKSSILNTGSDLNCRNDFAFDLHDKKTVQYMLLTLVQIFHIKQTRAGNLQINVFVHMELYFYAF